MKFLLTSAGITNKSLANALLDLVGKPFAETSIAFIPTAANVEIGDKGWLVDDLIHLKNLNLKCLDVVDISALSKEQWLSRLEAADVLFFSGGDEFHLMHWLNQSDLAKLLPDLLRTRVYAGISAGSMVVAKNLAASDSNRLYYENMKDVASEAGLGFFDFQIRPHLNSPYFTKVRKEFLEKLVKESGEVMYALDDQSGLKIIDDKIEVISEGEWLKL